MRPTLIAAIAALATTLVSAHPAAAGPNGPMAAEAPHLTPVPQWRSYWLCARRASAAMANKDLTGQFAVPQVETKCGEEKATYLLAEIDGLPNDQRVSAITHAEVACFFEALADVTSLEAYRGAGDGLVGRAPPNWTDPDSPFNRDSH